MAGEPSHLEIGVPDTKRAEAFWSGLLGWSFEPTDNGAYLDTGSLPGGIHPEPEPSVQIFFEVDDLEAAKRRVVELGGEVDEGESEGRGGRYLHSCRDDQGVPFGLQQRGS